MTKIDDTMPIAADMDATDDCGLELVRLRAVDAVERAFPLIAQEAVFARTPHAAITMRLHVAQLARELAGEANEPGLRGGVVTADDW